MDRWADGDGSNTGPRKPMGAVVRLGMGVFVKAGKGQNEFAGAPKIEVVASRREQKRQQMPPPPPMPSKSQKMPERIPERFQPPEWAGVPPIEAFLDVIKAGQVIDRLTLTKAATLFGRSPAADVVLDHPSLSRQHAALCYQRTSGRWVLVDLNSAHGTAVDGQQVPKARRAFILTSKDVPVQLQDGVTLRFAASSRDYILHHSAKPEGSAGADQEEPMLATVGEKRSGHSLPGVPKESQVKRSRGVQWADEAQPDSAQTHTALEQVIGYSDSSDFSAKVGPSSASEGEGKFANLVKSKVVGAKGAPEGLKEQHSKPKRPPETEGSRSRAPQPLLKSALFDWLPPPGSSAKAS